MEIIAVIRATSEFPRVTHGTAWCFPYFMLWGSNLQEVTQLELDRVEDPPGPSGSETYTFIQCSATKWFLLKEGMGARWRKDCPLQTPFWSVICKTKSRNHPRWVLTHKWNPNRHQKESFSHGTVKPKQRTASKTEAWSWGKHGAHTSIELFKQHALHACSVSKPKRCPGLRLRVQQSTVDP